MAIEISLTRFINKKKWIVPVLFAFLCVYFVLAIVAMEIRGSHDLEPKFAISIGAELCAMVIAIMVGISILPAYKRQSGYIRIFVTLLTCCSFCCLSDALPMMFDGIPELIVLDKIICVLLYVGECAFLYFFWLYSSYVLKSSGNIISILNIAIIVVLGIFTILPFINFFHPLYFTIDANGIYARNTDTWWISRLPLLFAIIFETAVIILSKEKLKTKIIIVLFMAFPAIAASLGGYRYGVSLLYTSFMVSLVMVYSFLFSDNEKHLYSTSKELGLATNIQKQMLPTIFPAFPGRKEFDVYAIMNPAKEVGGDFYDFFLVDETHLGLVVADVSDKGVPAALFMMASKIMVQNYALMGYSPKDVLTKVNQQICTNKQDEMFVTVWLGVLDLETGVLTAANAGHERPIIKRPDGQFEIIKDKHGMVVGYFSESVYTNYQIKLEKGSKLFLYTDGVPEARNKSDEQFGMERTLDTLNRLSSLSPEQISKNMLIELNKFIGNENQFDDITMLSLEYIGYDREIYEVVIPADVNKIMDGITPIISLLKEIGVEHKVVYKIEVAIEEILTNIASYAYGSREGNITIRYEVIEDPKTLVVTFIDEGTAFNPLDKEDPDITLSAKERKIGGLGLFIVKNTMDEVKYDRKIDKNIFIIKKKL